MSEHLISHIPGKRSSEEAGHFFRYMAEFVEFKEEDAQSVHESALIIEKHIPTIVSNFYANLLKHPRTRKFFLKEDSSIDEEYLQLRMYHQANFWRRTAGGVFDDEYAGFVDYVGRAHTSQGADKSIFIDERYVIGMVGFVQHAVIEALILELDGFNKDLEFRAIKAWNKLCIIILEMLSRAYREKSGSESLLDVIPIDDQAILEMSIESYERSLGIHRKLEYQNILVALETEIPHGERKIIRANGISIGVFHHKGDWYAIRNSCLHRGGPVASGKLVGDDLICPWHGYTYNITSGRLLLDPSARLDMFEVIVQEGEVFVRVPVSLESTFEKSDSQPQNLKSVFEEISGEKLKENEFFLKDVPPGRMRLVYLNRQRVGIYNVDGRYYATAEECTHAGGPLSEGRLVGDEVICPWHDSCFNVVTGAVTCPPADEPLQIFIVVVDGNIGRVEQELPSE